MNKKIFSNIEELEKVIFPALHKEKQEARAKGLCPCCLQPLPKEKFKIKED